MARLSLAALATVVVQLFATTTTAISTTSASGFVSTDESITFALNIPQDDDSNDLYFTMSGSSSASWMAVGMGNNKMANTLMLMVYADSTGKNITLSPRLAYGNSEPSYTSNITVNVLPGTQIANGKYMVNAMCQNCRSWKGGSIDPTNTEAQFIFAIGPHESFNSNSQSADIKRHASYGSFVMDLTKALGSAGVPIAATADSAGTSQTSDKTDHDFTAGLHACLMILAFYGLMPIGVLVLRILGNPKWHGYNQALSAAVALFGVIFGIYTGTLYNRSKHWNSSHQIIGTIIIIAMIGQFVLGFMHHRIYNQTLTTTKLAPIHIWLGRILIPLGIFNAFLGFPLALNPKYNWSLVALVLLITAVLGPFAFWKWRRNVRDRKAGLTAAGLSPGYQEQPWRSNGAANSNINLEQMNYPPMPGYGFQSNPPPRYRP